MHQVAVLLCLLTLSSSSGCQHLSVQPSDFHLKNLDAESAVEEANSIVLAYPVARRDVAKISFLGEGSGQPLNMLETETTLNVVQVIKGPALTPQIRFRHYRPLGEKILAGPPRGPSGPMFSRGIFFLDQRPDGIFRSVVDVYRPFIPTPWILRPVAEQVCAQPRECIARLLLTYYLPDDPLVFSNHLNESVAVSRQLTGFLNTFGLLSDLLSPTHPEAVRRTACSEFVKGYVLERPLQCVTQISGPPASEDQIRWAATLRGELSKGGVAWIQHRIGTDDDDGVSRYLRLLTNSFDVETRKLAKRLLARSR